MDLKKMIRAATVLIAVALGFCAPVSALSARSAVVMDAPTGRVLFEKDARERSMIASTTKIMTGLLVCEDLDPAYETVIPPEAAGIEGSSLYLKAGERVRVIDLLYGMMLRSGNDAATALAIAHSGSEAAFVRAMNERALALGLGDTHFANPHGLDDGQNYSTALDLALLARTAMENALFRRVVGTKSHRFGARTVVNHNKLLWRCEGAEGVKTGFTRAAGRILVSAVTRQGRRLICVTVRAPDDWSDHSTLYDRCFRQYHQRMLCSKGQVLGRIGDASAAPPADISALLLPGERVDRVRVHLGQRDAWAAFLSGDAILAKCPLEATGTEYGRTDSKDHSGQDGPVPPEGGGVDPCGQGAAQRQYRRAGRLRRPGGGRHRDRWRPTCKSAGARVSDAQ